MKSGKSDRRGTPQGGVVSPLLANLYMNRFLKHWRLTGRGEAFKAHVVAYADDFVILSRARAGEALAWTKAAMTKLGLTLNEAKTSLRDARKDRFDFLGYTFGPHRRTKDGRLYSGASPSKKSVHRIKTKIGEMLTPSNVAPWPKNPPKAEQAPARRVGVFQLRQPRQGVSGRRSLRRRSRARLPRQEAQDAKPGRATLLPFGHLRQTGSRLALEPPSQPRAESLPMKPVGKPDGGNPHVRFDERGRETEPLAQPQATAPFLDFTSDASPTRAQRRTRGGGWRCASARSSGAAFLVRRASE